MRWCSGRWAIWKFAKLHLEKFSIVSVTVLWLLGYVEVSAIGCLELLQNECQARKETDKFEQKQKHGYRSRGTNTEARMKKQKHRYRSTEAKTRIKKQKHRYRSTDTEIRHRYRGTTTEVRTQKNSYISMDTEPEAKIQKLSRRCTQTMVIFILSGIEV